MLPESAGNKSRDYGSKGEKRNNFVEAVAEKRGRSTSYSRAETNVNGQITPTTKFEKSGVRRNSQTLLDPAQLGDGRNYYICLWRGSSTFRQVERCDNL